jgi:gamma-glutamyl-gamma-aminobutyrate hydrolase PuuD
MDALHDALQAGLILHATDNHKPLVGDCSNQCLLAVLTNSKLTKLYSDTLTLLLDLQAMTKNEYGGSWLKDRTVDKSELDKRRREYDKVNAKYKNLLAKLHDTAKQFGVTKLNDRLLD